MVQELLGTARAFAEATFKQSVLSLPALNCLIVAIHKLCFETVPFGWWRLQEGVNCLPNLEASTAYRIEVSRQLLATSCTAKSNADYISWFEILSIVTWLRFRKASAAFSCSLKRSHFFPLSWCAKAPMKRNRNVSTLGSAQKNLLRSRQPVRSNVNQDTRRVYLAAFPTVSYATLQICTLWCRTCLGWRLSCCVVCKGLLQPIGLFDIDELASSCIYLPFSLQPAFPPCIIPRRPASS